MSVAKAASRISEQHCIALCSERLQLMAVYRRIHGMWTAMDDENKRHLLPRLQIWRTHDPAMNAEAVLRIYTESLRLSGIQLRHQLIIVPCQRM
ncbi:hypothetical protein D3C77_730890 [compost metagenome]